MRYMKTVERRFRLRRASARQGLRVDSWPNLGLASLLDAGCGSRKRLCLTRFVRPADLRSGASMQDLGNQWPSSFVRLCQTKKTGKKVLAHGHHGQP